MFAPPHMFAPLAFFHRPIGLQSLPSQPMARSGVLGGIIASVIGAFAALLVERMWQRHKEKRQDQQREKDLTEEP
jgi:uncharacterized protein (DUF2062 family)